MTMISDASAAGTLTGTAAARAVTAGSTQDQLGQKDFLQLMTAQLQNQDPFKPMQNGEFLAQMAQFSTVAGLDGVNETLSQISSQIGGNRIATASSLLGQQVLVPGTLARPDEAGEVHGVADLPTDASAVTVIYSDPATGAELARQDMGPQPAGLMGFSWTDLPADLRAARGGVRVSVQTDTAQPPDSFVYARVIGVQLPQDGTDMTLQVEDYGLHSSLEVSAIR